MLFVAGFVLPSLLQPKEPPDYDYTARERTPGLFCFAFPRLERFKFASYCLAPTGVPSLPGILPSLTQLTHLHFLSNSMIVSDEVLVAIAQHCPLLTNLQVVPSAHNLDQPLTDVGIVALASGCPHLATIHLDDRFHSSSLLDTLLSHSSSLTHLHLPCPQSSGEAHVRINRQNNKLSRKARRYLYGVDAVNAVLAKHAHVAQISTIVSPTVKRAYCSPHIRSLWLGSADTIAAELYLSVNPALTDVVVSSYLDAESSCEQWADIRRRFPRIKKLVWERPNVEDAARSEARYIQGNTDPLVYRVFF